MNERDLYLYKLMSMEVTEKLRRNAHLYQNRFPHVSRNYNYKAEENRYWTASFHPGMMYLAYDLTKEKDFLQYAGEYLDSFEKRLDQKVSITHDLGFLYSLSCVAYYKLTGNERAGRIAERAAEMLAERYHKGGKYIQAWGEFGLGNPYVRIIIDTMLNLPLLYWSDREEHHEIAEAHARTSAAYLIRDDFTSYHTFWMDPHSGRAIRGATHQGFRDESTWARGQAWSVYGFALSYAKTKKEDFLKTAVSCADVFINHLPADFIPYWDFNFNDNIPDIKDTSAASIFLCGLLELCKWVKPETASKYEEIIKRMFFSLYIKYFDHDPNNIGVLKGGMYHRDGGACEFTSWGDYFFFEALVRRQKDWQMYW